MKLPPPNARISGFHALAALFAGGTAEQRGVALVPYDPEWAAWLKSVEKQALDNKLADFLARCRARVVERENAKHS